jgi:hypothetical protein
MSLAPPKRKARLRGLFANWRPRDSNNSSNPSKINGFHDLKNLGIRKHIRKILVAKKPDCTRATFGFPPQSAPVDHSNAEPPGTGGDERRKNQL